MINILPNKSSWLIPFIFKRNKQRIRLLSREQKVQKELEIPTSSIELLYRNSNLSKGGLYCSVKSRYFERMKRSSYYLMETNSACHRGVSLYNLDWFIYLSILFQAGIHISEMNLYSLVEYNGLQDSKVQVKYPISLINSTF